MSALPFMQIKVHHCHSSQRHHPSKSGSTQNRQTQHPDYHHEDCDHSYTPGPRLFLLKRLRVVELRQRTWSCRILRRQRSRWRRILWVRSGVPVPKDWNRMLSACTAAPASICQMLEALHWVSGLWWEEAGWVQGWSCGCPIWVGLWEGVHSVPWYRPAW
ncbi:hypothetical protein EJ03DRAFT_174717 [Teratosphaeria nubilosa]|uniref:Uncharacterized protein n=1 Tax=Teratosphaeria nubilosa TaxID=161662 RepID=A0A6G1L220_9PEZI|nr:hypothetical protein EJ03DRAFT_174717 [Teratosphaeria nubilosa]